VSLRVTVSMLPQIAMDKRPFSNDDPENIGAWTPGIW